MAWARVSTCPIHRKKIFASEGAAKFEIHSLRGQAADPTRNETRAYPCPDGNGWHITSWEMSHGTF